MSELLVLSSFFFFGEDDFHEAGAVEFAGSNESGAHPVLWLRLLVAHRVDQFGVPQVDEVVLSALRRETLRLRLIKLQGLVVHRYMLLRLR